MDYFEAIKNLALPSPSQSKQFAADFGAFHSWYKHLNLYRGNKFLFFLNPAVAAGFSEENPRMHYGWKTTAEYRSKYGYLDFKYYDQDADFEQRNNRLIEGTSLELPEMLYQQNAVTLYPFVALDFNAIESIGYADANENLKKIEAAIDYPQKKLVLQWSDLHRKLDAIWDLLSYEEQDLALELMDENEVADIPDLVANYLQLDKEINLVYTRLQSTEQEKIELALEKLELTIKNNTP